jgi:hypothetical protein
METVKKNIYIPFYHSKVLNLNAQGWFVKVKFLITRYFQTITGFVKKITYFSMKNEIFMNINEYANELICIKVKYTNEGSWKLQFDPIFDLIC